MLSRTITLRRVSGVFVTQKRLFADSRKEGSVAQTKGFQTKEKAHEDQYVHRQNVVNLEKIKRKLEENREEGEKLQAEHDELAKKGQQ